MFWDFLFLFDGKIARWGAAIRFDSWPSRKNRYSLASELRIIVIGFSLYKLCRSIGNQLLESW